MGSLTPAPAAPANRASRSGAAIHVVGAACWVATILWAVRMDMGLWGMPGTMGMSFPSFVGMWALMMAAMMLSAMAPLALLYERTITDHRARGQRCDPVMVRRDEGVAHVLARQVGVQNQPLGLQHRHVLHRVHCDVDAAAQQRLLDLADGLGLTAYAVLGAAKALSYGIPPIPAVLMGVVTGTVGGIIRDVIAGRPSILMRPELYVTAAALSAALAVIGEILDLPRVPVWISASVAGYALRAAAIQWQLALPAYRDRDSERA